MAVKVSYIQTLKATAAQDRELIRSIFGAAGVLNGLAPTAAGGMTVSIATGKAILTTPTTGTSGVFGGLYHFLNDSAYVVTVGAAHATLPRIDAIVARVKDATEVGGDPLQDGGEFAVLPGTPTSGATLANLTGQPAIPVGNLAVAYVLVPAAAVAIIQGNISTLYIAKMTPIIQRPCFRTIYTSAFACAHASFVVVPFNVNHYDNDSMHVLNDSFVTINTPGVYLFDTGFYFPQIAATTQGALTTIMLQTGGAGTAVEKSRHRHYFETGTDMEITGAAQFYCQRGDKVYAQVYQYNSSSVSRNTGFLADYTNYFAGTLISQ